MQLPYEEDIIAVSDESDTESEDSVDITLGCNGASLEQDLAFGASVMKVLLTFFLLLAVIVSDA